MRYLKVRKNTTTPEEMAQGKANGTLEILTALMARSRAMASYQNQVRFFRTTEKWSRWARDAADGAVLEIDDGDHAWALEMLKCTDFSGIVVGHALAGFEDAPNKAPEKTA